MELTSMALVEHAGYAATGQRLPSRRPIDQRWDRSRGLIFSNAQRNVIRDFRWSRGNGIVFSECPASRREYAAPKRNLLAPSRSGQAGDMVQQSGPSAAGLTHSEHRLSPRDFGSPEDLRRRLELEQTRHKAEIQRLLTKHQSELESKDSRIGDHKRQIEDIKRQIGDIKRQNEAPRLELLAKEAELKDRESELSRKEADREQEIANIVSRADSKAQEHVKEKEQQAQRQINVAKKREREADDRQRDASRKDAMRKEQHDRMVLQRLKEDAEDLQLHKRRIEEAAEGKIAQEMQMQKEAREIREDERADYEGYHEVWDGMHDALPGLLSELSAVEFVFREKATYWKRAQANFKGEDIEPFSPHDIKYRALNRRLQEFLKTAHSGAETDVEHLKLSRAAIQTPREDLRSSGHMSRELTRYHHFGGNNAYTRMSLADKILNEEPIKEMRRQLKRDDSGTTAPRESAAGQETSRRLSQRSGERNLTVLAKMLNLFARCREAEALKALLRDSPTEKEVFMKTQRADSMLDRANDVWGSFTRENVGSVANSEVSLKDQERDRDSFVFNRRKVRDEQVDYENFVRKLRFLQAHLGQSRSDEEHLDAVIQEMIVAADRAAQVALNDLVQTRTTAITSSPSFTRLPHPVIERRNSETPKENVEPRSQVQLEQRLIVLKQQLEQPDAFSDDATKQRIHREIRDIKDALLRVQTTALQERIAKIRRIFPVDYATVQRLEKKVAERQAILAEEAPTASEKQDRTTVDPTPSSSLRRATTHKEKRKIRLLRTATPDESDAKSIASAASSDSVTRSSSAPGLNLQPTAKKEAPHAFCPISLRFFHVDSIEGNTQSDSEAVSSLPLASSTFADELAVSLPPVVCTDFESSEHVSDESYADSTSVRSSPSSMLETDDSFEPHDLSADIPVFESDLFQHQPLDKELTADTATATMPPKATAEDTDQSGWHDHMADGELSYQIPAEDYRNAVLASQNTNAAFWSYKLYKNKDGKAPVVYYCTNFEQAETRAKEFLNEPVVGFDMEWESFAKLGQSSIKNCVSLIQIASEDKIALFHLASFKEDTAEKLMPPSLRAILESKGIAKAGVNVQGDARRLEECFNMAVKGLFELSHLYKVVISAAQKQSVNKVLVSMEKQVRTVLLLPLKKDKVRTSSWSKRLKMEQTEYAASDAYAGLRLYHALEAKRKKMDPMPPRPALYEEHKPLQLANGRFVVAKPYVAKPKRDVVDDGGKAAEEDDDDDCQEYFDAVEDLDTYQIDSQGTAQAAVEPLSGVTASYPTPPPQRSQTSSSDNTEAEQDEDSHQTQQPLTSSQNNAAAAAAAAKPTKRAPPPPSPEVARADSWATTWRASLPAEYNLKVGHPALRAYHLWHAQELDCARVAALLRDPPLSVQTIASYVMQALKEENLPYGAARVQEPLGILPKSVHGRYGKIVSRLE